MRRMMKPKLPKQLQDTKAPWYHEVIGTVLSVAVLWTVTGVLSWLWALEYAIPTSKLSTAECLVLSSEMQTSPTGFQRAPLYRAVVQVYLFNSSVPIANCTPLEATRNASNTSATNSSRAEVRCNEVLGTAYDTLSGKFTMHDKTAFLLRWGHPGNFYRCLHSRDLKTIVFERNISSVFLMAPIVAFLVGLYAIVKGVLRVRERHRVAKYYSNYRKVPQVVARRDL